MIKWSCNPKITQANRLYWKFFQTCGRTHLQHSSPHDDCGKICSLGSSFLLASGLINVSHSINRIHQSPGEKEKCASLGIILGLLAFILFFYFHFINLFWFLGKLTTSRPWPTPGFVPTPPAEIMFFLGTLFSTELCNRTQM